MKKLKGRNKIRKVFAKTNFYFPFEIPQDWPSPRNTTGNSSSVKSNPTVLGPHTFIMITVY